MKLKLLTYNLLFNKAINHVETVTAEHKPDVVLLQEFQTSTAGSTPIEKMGYKLANYSNSFFKHNTTYGVATYYNPKTISVEQSVGIDLPRSIYELFLILFYGGNKPRTVLKTDFKINTSDKKFTVYNMHLSWFNTNSLRIKQIIQAFNTITINSHPVLVGGDFNYPYGRKKFEDLIERYRLKEATNTIYYTFEKRVLKFIKLRWKLDYILYQNIEEIKAERIEITDSDHYPIISSFEI